MSVALSKQTREKIDKWLLKFPPTKKQSAVLYALRIVQEEHSGWLSQELMDRVASYLEIPNIAVYEVASFYSMFELSPTGKHKISVCTNISCMLNGSDEVVKHLQNRLKIGFNETTPDGQFTLKEVECLAACQWAPVVQVGSCLHQKVSPDRIDQLLDEIEN